MGDKLIDKGNLLYDGASKLLASVPVKLQASQKELRDNLIDKLKNKIIDTLDAKRAQIIPQELMITELASYINKFTQDPAYKAVLQKDPRLGTLVQTLQQALDAAQKALALLMDPMINMAITPDIKNNPSIYETVKNTYAQEKDARYKALKSSTGILDTLYGITLDTIFKTWGVVMKLGDQINALKTKINQTALPCIPPSCSLPGRMKVLQDTFEKIMANL